MMLRFATRGARALNAVRSVSTSAVLRQEAVTSAESKKAFLAKFAPYQGTLAEPEFPSNYLKPSPPVPESIPEKLKLTFAVPNAVLLKEAEVDLVLLPAESGDFGAAPGHVPTIAQLRPGVVTVQTNGDKDVAKWFVSGGFAFVHPNSTADVVATAAHPLADFDPEAVRAALADATAKVAAAAGKDEYEAASAQAAVEVYSALSAALGL